MITWRSRWRLRSNSLLIAREQTQLVKALQEGLGGIRDVLLDGTQAVYCEVYGRADRHLRRAQGANVYHLPEPALQHRSARHGPDRRPRLRAEPPGRRPGIGAARARRARDRRAAAAAGAAAELRRLGDHHGQPGVAARHDRAARSAREPRAGSGRAGAAAAPGRDSTRSRAFSLRTRRALGAGWSQPRHSEGRANRLRRQHRQRQEHDARPAHGSARAD